MVFGKAAAPGIDSLMVMPKLFTLPQTQSPHCEPVRAVLPFPGAARRGADVLARAGFGVVLADGAAGCDDVDFQPCHRVAVDFQHCHHRVAENARRGSPPASLHLANWTDDDDPRGYTE